MTYLLWYHIIVLTKTIVKEVFLRSHSKKHAPPKQRINHAITASEVMVILPDGSTIPSCNIQQALQMAQDQELDLVEVATNTTPPVCKILDYGKLRYTQNKKNRSTTKKNQLLKEIRMQPKISEHDLQFKTNHIKDFLLAGHKVKVTIRFRGRELSHTELGEVILRQILEMLDCNFTIDREPLMEGRTMFMILSPSSKPKKSTNTQQKNTHSEPITTSSSEPTSDETQ